MRGGKPETQSLGKYSENKTLAVMKQVIFFVTHIFDARVEKRLKKIISDTEGLCDVYIATNKPHVIPDKYSKIVLTWSIKEMHERNPQLISNGYL